MIEKVELIDGALQVTEDGVMSVYVANGEKIILDHVVGNEKMDESLKRDAVDFQNYSTMVLDVAWMKDTGREIPDLLRDVSRDEYYRFDGTFFTKVL